MPATASKIAAGRVIQFAFAEPVATKHRNRRHEQVAAAVEGWLDARIVSELYGPRRCYLLVVVPRPISAAVAESLAQECPGYVRGSCEIIGE
jgi:hypothetical protein